MPKWYRLTNTNSN